MKICQVDKKIVILYTIFVLFLIFIPLKHSSAAIDVAGAGSISEGAYDKLFGGSGSMFGSKINCVLGNQGDVDAAYQKAISGVSIGSITVTDSGAIGALSKVICTDQRNGVERAMDAIKGWAIDEALVQLKKAGDVAYKQALRFFLNTLAYDTATYLATGDKGQLPMFETEGWGGYLKNVADNTAGSFIEQLGENMGTLKFNLCTPDLSVMLKINLGLQKTYRPKAPACTFSKLVDNWDEALKDKDFLPKFQDMFNPWSNDLGIALTLQTGIESEISQKVNEAAQDRIEGKGWRPVRSAIEGRIQTPADIVGAAARQPILESTASEKVYTGSIIADSIDIFINTLIGRLMDKWLKKGLVTDFPNTGRWNSLSDPNAQKQEEGIAGAESRFRSLTEPNFKVRGDYNILAELTSCPDPNKAGPTNCVIDEKFRQAIEKRLTVKEAMEQGYLNGNGVFGFTSDGLEPRFNEGYPYRSMLILRKFRILPMGWEIAAQYIKDCQNNTDPAKCQNGNVNGTKNLSDLVNCNQSWCAGLVDPNWVLKAPQNFCKKEGAGPEILSEQVTGEGAGSSLSILRNDNYCADEQSCIKEKTDGACQQYGYCTEERRTWDFNGKSCEPRDNTCQTFQLGDQAVSYLQNTLDFSVCNAGNAGCKKYATSGTYANGTVDWNENNLIYLNKNAAACEAADQGCHEFIRQGVKVYEKLLPNYLQDVCYQDDGDKYSLKNDAPAQCSKFARQCKSTEVGCEMYTGATNGLKIPAIAKPGDGCPAVCAGYDTYIQSQTAFAAAGDEYFIPRTAKTCSAEAAGCAEFTNLDEVKKGGEAREYYVELKRCVKPDAKACAEFYTWEGSDESGFQLKVFSLEKNNGQPKVTAADGNDCTEAIYKAGTNADCRQFYNRAGEVSYHLISRTITCSDDCHPYRKTEPLSCTAASADVDCAGGGSCENGRCIYNAIPGQGRSCSAAQSGCREYVGNTGNNIRHILTDDFSAGQGGWQGLNGATVTPSSEAVTLGAFNRGHSIKITASAGGLAMAERQVGSAVREGKSYVLNFVVKADKATELDLSLTNSVGASAAFARVRLTAGWQIWQTNLTVLNHEATSSEILRLTPILADSNNFYLDNITLTEIVDRYYLIKNSWQTPEACYNDLSGEFKGPLYNLGCSQYSDRAGKTHYLKSFSELCSESSVGCEKMTDTKNSSAPADDGDIYAVYDQSKLCDQAQKGCALLGQAYKYETATLYGDVYLKNNPDKYGTIQCSAEAVGCQTFAYDQGEKYFKDPGDLACEWRRQTGAGESYGWYKKKVKRCGSDSGTVCLSGADCSGGAKCQLETTDKACPTDENKTLGLGGVGGRVSQPGADANGKWAGICAAANSGCGEYIDPVSKFNTNLIFNGSFQILASNKNDGWSGSSPYTQNVTLEPNAVYRLARVVKEAGSLTISGCPSALYEINQNNNLAGPSTSITVNAAGYANSKIFYYQGSASASCSIAAGSSAGAVELKPVAIDYQLAQNLDSAGCNGVVDFNKGCVLFNERSQAGASLKPLDSDADTSSFGSAAASAEKDSNAILKVTPDRTCDKWLACRSYIKDEKGNNTCFDVGLCDALDDKGDCSSFLNSPKTNQTVSELEADKISNLSGYAKAGLTGGSLKTDYYPFGAMTQIGETANLANGGFEFYGANGYPVGWNWSVQEAAGKSWDANVFSVINNPISAQAEGIGYAREGRAFLKLGSSYDATSEDLDVIPNTDYIITAYVNTKNLKSGQAKIDIVDGAGAAIRQAVITQDLGNDWRFEVGQFNTGGNSRIKIKLYSSAGGTAGSEGNFYFDDVKIRPALNSKDDWYTTQSCRLYSKTDSLSCDYYEDSGNRQKGWYGYCLEYDRAPGDPNACLLWYPVDKVKGDGIEEGAGYQGKAPVYYCADTVMKINIPSALYNSQYKPNGKPTNIFWADQASHGDISGGFVVDYPKLVIPGGNYEIRNATGRGPKAAILSNNSDILKISGGDDGCNNCFSESTYSFDLYDSGTNEKVFSWSGNIDRTLNIIFTRVDAYCSKVAKTVTEVGQNKFWSSRVYQGSIYELPCGSFDLNNMNFSNGVCGYNSDSAPFGSINASGLNMFNPYDWDDNQNAGIQPLTFLTAASSPRMTKYYNQSELKRLFAQSYGGWSWSGDGADGRYAADNSLNWSLPNCLCGTGGCDANFCANAPGVTNVKINGSSSNTTLTKNGFVNLTFNTKVDSNQLPLVMYAIDWGDDSKTTVTGVEMRDRPNPDNPHSLYHLYSYWDLKAKANSGIIPASSCTTGADGVGQCKIQPKVQIKDNWGWCNGGTAMNDCDQLQPFLAEVVVKEK